MSVQLPIDAAAPSYRMGITLNSVPFIFDVRWNAIEGAWYFDLRDVNEQPIRCGIKIVLGTLLGVRSASADMPTGVIIASDLSGKGRDATIDDLGSRVVLYFYDASEL